MDVQILVMLSWLCCMQPKLVSSKKMFIAPPTEMNTSNFATHVPNFNFKTACPLHARTGLDLDPDPRVLDRN